MKNVVGSLYSECDESAVFDDKDLILRCAKCQKIVWETIIRDSTYLWIRDDGCLIL
jgi:hypothetical protein